MAREFNVNLFHVFDDLRGEVRMLEAVPLISALVLLHTLGRYPEHFATLGLTLPEGAVHDLQQSLNLPAARLEGYVHEVLRDHLSGHRWELDSSNLNDAVVARASRAVGNVTTQLTSGLDGTAGLERLGAEFSQFLEYVVRQFPKSSGFVQTPETVAQLMAELLDAGPGMKILDFTSGFARTLVEVVRLQRRRGVDPNSLWYVGQEIDPQSALLGAVHLVLNGVTHFRLHVGDVLTDPRTGQEEFDRVVADPPLTLPVRHLVGRLEHDPRFVFVKKNLPKVADWLFLQHGLTSLKPGGRAVFMTAHGSMFRGGTEASIRQHALATRWLNTVMALPSSLYPNIGVPMVLSLFDRPTSGQAGFSEVLMIDASGQGTRQGRIQHLTDETRAHLVGLVQQRGVEPELSVLVSHERIQQNSQAWQPNQYLQRTAEDKRKLQDIRGQLAEKVSALREAEQKLEEAFGALEGLQT